MTRALVLPPALDPRLHPPDDVFLRLLPRRDGDRVALPPALTYVFIVFTNRSGSTYLAELLASGGVFNRGEEVLNPEAAVLACKRHGWGSLSSYFAAIAGRDARNGNFVAKATIGQLAMLDWHGVLPRILERCRFLVIERMDKLGQAISWQIANQTGAFNSLDGPRSRVVPAYDGAALRGDIDRLAQQHAHIDLFMALNGLVPFHLSYETLIAEPEPSARLVCRHLGLPAPESDPARVRLERQATERNAAWRDRFLAERGRRLAAPAQPAAPPPSSCFHRATLAALLAERRVLADGGPAVQRFGYLPSALFEVPPHAYGDAGPEDAGGGAFERPAIPAWLLRDAVVHGKHGLITLGDRVVAESLRDVPLPTLAGAGWEPDGRLRLPQRRPAPPVAAGYHLLAGELEDYRRWLLDIVGRFAPEALALLGRDAAPVVLVPQLDVFWKWESYGLVVPGGLANLAVSPEEQVAVARLLYVPDLSGGGVLPHPALLEMFDHVRREAIGAPDPAWRPWRRLYVARPPAGGQGPANEAAVAARLARAGFARVAPGEHSVIEQARLFAEATHVLAAHGADLANIGFCAAGARLLELHRPGPKPLSIRRLAALRGVAYGCLTGRPDPAAPDGWRIDLAGLAAVLADPAFIGG